MRRIIVIVGVGGLAVASFLGGCAPGYYARPRPVYGQPGPVYGPRYGYREGHEARERREHEEHEAREHARYSEDGD